MEVKSLAQDCTSTKGQCQNLNPSLSVDCSLSTGLMVLMSPLSTVPQCVTVVNALSSLVLTVLHSLLPLAYPIGSTSLQILCKPC